MSAAGPVEQAVRDFAHLIQVACCAAVLGVWVCPTQTSRIRRVRIRECLHAWSVRERAPAPHVCSLLLSSSAQPSIYAVYGRRYALYWCRSLSACSLLLLLLCEAAGSAAACVCSSQSHLQAHTIFCVYPQRPALSGNSQTTAAGTGFVN